MRSDSKNGSQSGKLSKPAAGMGESIQRETDRRPEGCLLAPRMEHWLSRVA